MIYPIVHPAKNCLCLAAVLACALFGDATTTLAQQKPSPPPATASPAPATPAKPESAAARPAESKPTEPKQAEPKPAAAKASEAKPTVPATLAAKPAQGNTAEAKPAAERPAAVKGRVASYVLLGRPAQADRLKLTVEQRSKIAALLAERSEAIVAASGSELPKVLAESEQKLAAVLTDAQRAEWEKLPAEPMLRLNFRYQKWLDVLEWLAKQAGGLSLFCDHPPEGTFNYTDPKEYTVTEALDLVNGVLLMKGYSLVRHEQMLVCIDLSEPIPIGLTDVVTPEQAESRGKFELVTCTFPLAGRDAAAASAEIKLLLGSYSKVVPLAATGQLQVTDAAGNMKRISALIQSMAPAASKAAAGAAAAAAAAAEPAVLAVYPLKTADAKTAEKILTTLFPPPAKIVVDPGTDQVHVQAAPRCRRPSSKSWSRCSLPRRLRKNPDWSCMRSATTAARR